MPVRDRLLALLVALCWGVNFPATHLALEQFPPFTLAALRFTLLAVPTVLFVPRPAVPWRWLIGYGLGFGVAQFAFLYLAMAHGMPSGLASLVLQCSAPATVLLGALLLRERLGRRQVIGVSVAVAALVGLAVVRAQAAAVLPVLLTVLGGIGWAFGNLASRRARPDRPLAFLLWMSVVPPVPMALLALVVEGPHRIGRAFTSVSATAFGGLAYVVVFGSVVGGGIWTWLMSRYPSSRVAPFSMAVPAFGFASSWLVLGEHLDPVELALGGVVVAGVLWGMTTSRRKVVVTDPDAAVCPIGQPVTSTR